MRLRGGVLAVGVVLSSLDLLQAQSAIVTLDAQQRLELRDHVRGPRVAIHVDRAKYARSPFDLFEVNVELEVVVSESGRVESAHAIHGPEALYKQAEDIEMARTFSPFLVGGKPVRFRFQDDVRVLPPEEWLPKHIPFPADINLSSLGFTLQRFGCFGVCPVYQVTVLGNGVVQFDGRAFVLAPGYHVAHISPDAVKDLLDAFRKADFLSAKDNYAADAQDNASQRITFSFNGRSKSVLDYLGEEVGIPDAIADLERRIDEVAGTERWVEGNEETLPALRAERWDFSSGSKVNLALYRVAILRHLTDVEDALIRAKAPVIDDENGQDRPVSTLFPGLPYIQDPGGAPIQVASGIGDVPLVERMLDVAKARKEPLRAKLVQSCLAQGIRSGNLEMLSLWMEQGANLAESGAGESALEGAVASHNPEMVKRVLEYPLDVHARVASGEPLLMFAVQNEAEGKPATLKILKLLIQAGADVNQRNDAGETALFAVGEHSAAFQVL